MFLQLCFSEILVFGIIGKPQRCNNNLLLHTFRVGADSASVSHIILPMSKKTRIFGNKKGKFLNNPLYLLLGPGKAVTSVDLS